MTPHLPDDLDAVTRDHLLRVLARAPERTDEVLPDGQKVVFSQTEVERGAVEQLPGADKPDQGSIRRR